MDHRLSLWLWTIWNLLWLVPILFRFYLHGLRLPVGAGTTNKREFHIVEDTTYRSDDEVTRELRTIVYTVFTGLLINPFLVEVIQILIHLYTYDDIAISTFHFVAPVQIVSCSLQSLIGMPLHPLNKGLLWPTYSSIAERKDHFHRVYYCHIIQPILAYSETWTRIDTFHLPYWQTRERVTTIQSGSPPD